MSANNKQVGGTHYAEGGNCQHWDYIALNGIGYLEGCATKYVTRWRKKHGKLDLQKALHYIEKLSELYMTGKIGTPILRAPLSVSAEDFAIANDLTVKEFTVVRLLTGWRDQSDLHTAWEIVDSMIKEA